MHHSFVQRLAFIKFLYVTGNRQAQAAAPLSSAGLLMLHDSIELFLDVACEHLGVTEQVKEFKSYWGPINAKLAARGAPALSQQASVLRLNKGRVSLKHHGGHPAKIDLDAYRNTAREFFADNFPLVFDLSIEDVSMADFIEPESARDKIQSAIQLKAKGDFNAAAAEIAVGFDMMLFHQFDQDRSDYGDSRLFGHHLSFAAMHLRGLEDIAGRDAENALRDTIKTVEQLQSTVQMLALGVDLRSYRRFKSIVPISMRMAAGNYHIQEMRTIDRDEESIQFCIDFVIETAIQMTSTG